MADQAGTQNKPFDTMDPWRGMRNAYLDAWSKAMIEMVNSEAYAQATGAILDTYLSASAPFHEVIEKTMLKTLEQLVMPSRADVLSIAERMTNIEMRLDDLDAKLDEVRELTSKAGANRPRRASSRRERTGRKRGQR